MSFLRIPKHTGLIGWVLVTLLLFLSIGVPPVHAVRPGEVSWTAEGVCATRAVGAMAPDEKIRNPDYLAGKFVSQAYWRYAVYNKDDYALNIRVVKAYRADTYFLVNARTHKIDEALKNFAKRDLEQVVILGAGFDTRAYRYAEKMPSIKFFELDLPATLQRKKELVKKAIGRIPDDVAYAPIDFNTETIEEALVRVGYDPAKKTYFVWEGVTMYITEAAVKATLDFIANRSAPGSEVVFDYLLAGVAARDWKRYPHAMVLATLCAVHDEPWIFGFPEPSATEFVQNAGLEVLEDLDGKAMSVKYMTQSDGKIDGYAGDHWGLMHARVLLH